MPGPAWRRFEPTRATPESALAQHPTVTRPLTLPRPPHSRRVTSQSLLRRANHTPVLYLDRCGVGDRRDPNPVPHRPPVSVSSPPSPSASAAAGQDRLVGRLPETNPLQRRAFELLRGAPPEPGSLTVNAPRPHSSQKLHFPAHHIQPCFCWDCSRKLAPLCFQVRLSGRDFRRGQP
jgi:hypothetical protein